MNKKDPLAAAVVFLESFKLNPYCTLLLKGYFDATNKQFYIPWVVEATPVKELTIGKYKAVIVSEIKSMGKIGYDYIMFLFEGEEEIPMYFVSLENNTLYDEMGGPKDFLCAFDKEQGHVNFGGFELELNVENFEKKAIEIISSRFQV